LLGRLNREVDLANSTAVSAIESQHSQIVGREESFEAPGWMRRGAKRARPRISDSRDPIPYALETDWPVGAAGFEPLHLRTGIRQVL
jgi:hypothetical protein